MNPQALIDLLSMLEDRAFSRQYSGVPADGGYSPIPRGQYAQAMHPQMYEDEVAAGWRMPEGWQASQPSIGTTYVTPEDERYNRPMSYPAEMHGPVWPQRLVYMGPDADRYMDPYGDNPVPYNTSYTGQPGSFGQLLQTTVENQRRAGYNTTGR